MFTAWTEPTLWQARTYGTVDRPVVGRLSRLLKRTGLAPDVRSRLLSAYAEELVGEDDPAVMAAAREALGELALLLGRHDEAAAHFARAAAIADQWNAPHWSADARARADLAHSARVYGGITPGA